MEGALGGATLIHTTSQTKNGTFVQSIKSWALGIHRIKIMCKLAILFQLVMKCVASQKNSTIVTGLCSQMFSFYNSGQKNNTIATGFSKKY